MLRSAPLALCDSRRFDHLSFLLVTETDSPCAWSPILHPDNRKPAQDPIAVDQNPAQEHCRPPRMALQVGLVGGRDVVEGDHREDGKAQVRVGLVDR